MQDYFNENIECTQCGEDLAAEDGGYYCPNCTTPHFICDNCKEVTSSFDTAKKAGFTLGSFCSNYCAYDFEENNILSEIYDDELHIEEEELY